MKSLRAAAARRGWTTEALAMAAIIALQAVAALFFVADTVFDIIHETSTDALHNLFELAAVLGLVFGIVVLAREIRRILRRHTSMARQLDAARGAFHMVIEARFADWGLTPAQRDVALLSIKGLTIAEIAAARGARDGTVKAQLSAIYGKAGVSNRAQLLGLFIDELVDGPILAPG